MLEANEMVIGERIERSYASLHGHVVVRVANGGDTYSIFILNDNNSNREIINKFGPFESR
jgi:hypothetical protein